MIRVLIGIVVLAAIGIGVMVFLQSRNHKAEPSAPPPSYSMKLEELTVNLADLRDAHYLKVVVELNVTGTGPIKEFTDKWQTTIIDSSIEVFSARTYASLLALKGKRAVKQELKGMLNDRMKDTGWQVKEVLFTEFVME